MLEIYFNYFQTLIICIVFFLILFFNTIYKGKDLYIDYIFCSIATVFFFYLVFTQKSITTIKEHYQSYKSLNEDDIIKMNYYDNIKAYKQGYINSTITDKEKIKSFLNKANLSRGLYFKDVTTRNSYSEYLVEIISNTHTYIIEIYQDFDNYKVAYFMIPCEGKSVDRIGRYYFETQLQNSRPMARTCFTITTTVNLTPTITIATIWGVLRILATHMAASPNILNIYPLEKLW